MAVREILVQNTNAQSPYSNVHVQLPSGLGQIKKDDWFRLHPEKIRVGR